MIAAALATLIFGAVLGPEMPLVAVGGGLAALAVRLARREVPDQARAVVASAGSFAAISTLLGSPILGAFLLMEASGLAGATLSLMLVPGLLASGIGTLMFVGLGSWTGLGTFSLAIPGLPHFGSPDIAKFGWALVIGVAAALVGSGIRRLGALLHSYADRRVLISTPLAGLAHLGLVISGKRVDELCGPARHAARRIAAALAPCRPRAMLPATLQADRYGCCGTQASCARHASTEIAARSVPSAQSGRPAGRTLIVPAAGWTNRGSRASSELLPAPLILRARSSPRDQDVASDQAFLLRPQ